MSTDLSPESSQYQRMPNADYGSTTAGGTTAAASSHGEWKEDGRPSSAANGNGANNSSSNSSSSSSSVAAASAQPNGSVHPSKYESPVAIAHLPEQSVTHVNFHNLEDDDEESVQARLSPHEHTLEQGSSSQESSKQNLAALEFPASSSSSSSSSATSGSKSNSSAPATMIAFINFHSGGKTGEQLAKDLVKALGEDKVFDLKGDKGPAKGLRQFKGTPNLRVVIGGGDGTINWVLSTMRAEGMADVPAGCIPLGTGNDSSRAFGWGFKYPGVKKVVKNIDRMRVCPVEHMVKYDRWHAFAQYERPVTAEWLESLPASVVPIRQESDLPEFYRHPHAISLPPVPPPKKTTKHDVDGEKPRPYRAATIDHDAQAEGYNVQAIPLHARGEHIPPVALERPPVAPTDSGITPRGDQDGVGAYFGSQWNNYMSWGVDAQIQASFHHKREACRMCFCCRPCNMAWMGCLGATNFLGCQADALDVSVEVRDDSGQWVLLPLPPGLRTIVCLNTPTYAGGRFLWGKEDRKRPSKAKEWECTPQRQSADDGLFEIVGITGTMHLGMIMIELSRGIRLAQVNEARLTFGKPIWCQADGEPFRDALFGSVTYHIRPLKPSTLMTRPDKALRGNDK